MAKVNDTIYCDGCGVEILCQPFTPRRQDLLLRRLRQRPALPLRRAHGRRRAAQPEPGNAWIKTKASHLKVPHVGTFSSCTIGCNPLKSRRPC
jgi:hypothetical protein